MHKDLLKSLPDDKILGWSKLEALADDKINSAKMRIFVRVETLWKEIIGIFSFPHKVFKRVMHPRSLKGGTVW